MSRFEQISDPTSDSPLAGLYQEIVDAGLGRRSPINWFTAQSARPDILAATWRLVKGLLLGGQLPSTLKQMILVRVSNANHCRYCKVIHTNALAAMGVPPEVIDSVTTDVTLAKLTPVQRSVVEFSTKASSEPQAVSHEDLEALRLEGLSSGEIMEAAMIGALADFVNTWADVSGIRVDSEQDLA